MADTPSRRVGLGTLCARHSHAIAFDAAEFDASVSQPLSPPVQLSSVYRIPNLDTVDALYAKELSGFIYARDGHPLAEQLAAKIAVLEGAEAGFVCGSGMGAEAAILLALLSTGAEIAYGKGIYGKTRLLFTQEFPRFGVTAWEFDPTDADSAARLWTDRTRIIFVETLGNPMLRLADFSGLSALARTRGALLIVDHTFAPLLCRPLELGADIVLHSATKALSGHSDVTLGVAAGAAATIALIRTAASAWGYSAPPFDSWLTLRGLSTLALRAARSSASAHVLALQFQDHPAVAAVHYPGLPNHPDHARAVELFDPQFGFGAILTVDLESRYRADAFLQNLKNIPFAPSLGDVTTTLSHPATTSHRGQTPEAWAAQGITPGLIRFSIGLEDIEDLWAEIHNALDLLPPR